MNFLDGHAIADRKLKTVRKHIVDTGAEPRLAVILVGHDPASELYVKLKEKTAKKVGIELRRYLFNKDTSEKDIEACITFLNTDIDTDGIIVQLPLPTQLSSGVIVNMVDPHKDVDGFHKENQEKFFKDTEIIYPVFPGAIMSLIHAVEKNLSDKNVVVVGKSDIFDRVMTHALTREGAHAEFVQLIDEKKKISVAQKKMIKDADIVVSALGRAHYFSGGDFKNDAIVIDGGISRVNDETIGDVDQESCADTDITLSSVPGGVGPVTVACLLENTFSLSQR